MSPLLCELHWLRVTERIEFRLAVLAHRRINGTAPRYLAGELERVADTASRQRLRSASSPALHVPRSLHKTIGDRAFPVAATIVWNRLPPAIIVVFTHFQVCTEDGTATATLTVM